MLPTLIDRVIQTLRYHHPSQFARRFERLALERLHRLVGTRFRPTWNQCSLRSERIEGLIELAQRRRQYWPAYQDSDSLERICDAEFTFLNQTHALSAGGHDRDRFPKIHWRPTANRLWLFKLQYQEYLLNLSQHVGPEASWWIIRSWLSEPMHQDPRKDPNAWHPFCISRRLPVWLMLAAESNPPKDLEQQFWRSIANQTQWLRSHLEYELGGNHLFENLRTLAIAANYLEGDIAIDGDWLRGAILRQLEVQILPTGEHFERTPTYHAVMLSAVLEIGRSWEADPSRKDDVRRLRKYAVEMKRFLQSILHPDGNIPLLSDSVLDETPDPQLLCAWAEQWCSGQTQEKREFCSSGSIDSPQIHIARRAESDPVTLAPSDYWAWRSDDGNDYLLLDHGPLACDHLPAHGHADLMNFEASVKGKRWIVDGGTFDYEASEMRAYCRGTAAHNTLQVDGVDHADLWSRFRMGRRGHPTHFQSGEVGNIKWACGFHDAYSHLGIDQLGTLVAACPGPWWMILQWIDAPTDHDLVTRLRLHPEIDVSRSGSDSYCFLMHREDPDRRYRIDLLGDAEMEIDRGWYCPEFGQRHRIDVMKGALSQVRSDWVGWLIQPVGSGDFAGNIKQPLISWRPSGIRVEIGSECIALDY